MMIEDSSMNTRFYQAPALFFSVTALSAALFGCDSSGELTVYDDQEIIEDVSTHQHGELMYFTDNASLMQQVNGGVIELRPEHPFMGTLLNIASDDVENMEYAYLRQDGSVSEFAPVAFTSPESRHTSASITLNEMATVLWLRVGASADSIEFLRAEFMDTSVPESDLHFDDDWDVDFEDQGITDNAARLELSRSGRYIPPSNVVARGRSQNVPYNGAPSWNRNNCSGSFKSGARELADFLVDTFPGARSYGGYACRQNTANRSKMSVHGTGRAIDLFVPLHRGQADNDLGDPIANWLIENAEAVGVQYFIWDRTSWNASRGGDKHRSYGGPHPHHDHLHIELSTAGANKQTSWFRDRGTATDPDSSGGSSSATCFSRTLGQSVPAGECVQMNYDACGGGTCNWAKCSDQGAWQCTPESSCSGTKHGHADCGSSTTPAPQPTQPTGDSCFSRTLGRNVDDGTCVQMNYNSCGGAGTCQWAACDDGSWQCTPESSCSGDKFGHTDCGGTTSTGGSNTPTGDQCWSKTLGRRVDHGGRVQMSYDACGGTCQWATCDDGKWTCGSNGSGDEFAHSSCGGGSTDRDTSNNTAGAPGVPADRGRPIGDFKITYYYKALEAQHSGANTVAIKDTNCQTIKTVPQSFASSLCIEGSGLLEDGRVVNYGQSCGCNPGCSYCYSVLDRNEFPWGMGNRSNALIPMRSLAVDTRVIRNGRVIYLEEFDGVQIPSIGGVEGFTHDGCFRADDVGGAIISNHFDVFAAHPDLWRHLEGVLPTNSRLSTWVDTPKCQYLAE